MSWFKRLGRLVEAEYNSLRGRFATSEEEQAENASAEEELKQAAPKHDTSDNATSRWPDEVRRAYAALELPLGRGPDEVKRQYRELLKRYHPDRHAGNAERERVANELTAKLREQYDLLMRYLEGQAR